jgi:hypothetical protein
LPSPLPPLVQQPAESSQGTRSCISGSDFPYGQQ